MAALLGLRSYQMEWREEELSDVEESYEMERSYQMEKKGAIRWRRGHPEQSWQPSCLLFLVEGFLVQVLRLLVRVARLLVEGLIVW